ncbi:MAG: hypothetical protein ACR2JK_13450 [Geodermatophilaceae bacterium]
MDRDRPTEMIPIPAVSEFEVVLRGYDRAQVRETIERLDADVRIALTDRDAAVARSSDLASQLSAVHGEMESLRRKLATTAAPTYETMGERIAHMLRLAEEEAAEIRRTAHTDTGTLREEAQAMREQTEARQQKTAAEAERIRLKAESDAAKSLTAVGQKAADVRSAAEQKATTLVADAEARRDRLMRESDERNKRADEDFEISLRERRREAARIEAERLRVSTDEANRRVAEATSEAQSRVAAATAQSAEMIAAADRERQRIEGIRQTALRQLREVRELLAGLPADTRPPAETPATPTAATPTRPQPAQTQPIPPKSDSTQKPTGHAEVPVAPSPAKPH